MKNHKKTYFTIIIFLIFIIILTSGCSFAKIIPDGIYESKNPYMKLTYNLEGLPDFQLQPQEIEINGTIHTAIALTDYGSQITFYEPKDPECFESTSDAIDTDHDYIFLGRFKYKLNNNNTKLQLTNKDTGEVYILDKIE